MLAYRGFCNGMCPEYIAQGYILGTHWSRPKREPEARPSQKLFRFPLGRSGSSSHAMAAPILSYEGLGLVQGSGWLFRGLDIHIGQRDRLALIGRNGAGKTTLLKLIGGKIDADEGRRPIVARIGVLILVKRHH